MKSDIRSVFDAIGRGEIMRHLGISSYALDMAIHREAIPASWYQGLRFLSESKSISPPEDRLFNWKEAAPQQEERAGA